MVRGLGPAIVATGAAVLFAEIFLLERRWEVTWESLFSVAIFTSVALIIATLFESLRHARDVEKELHEQVDAKGDYVGFVSHELRNPAAILLAGASLLKKRLGPSLEPVDAELLDDISQEADRLVDILENLLVLAQSDREFGLEPEPLRLECEVARAVQKHGRRFPNRPILCDLGAPVPPVLGNSLLIGVTLDNLIGNAEKYSPDPASPITVSMRAQLQMVELRVLDEGIGIDEDAVGLLFSPFFRSGTATRRASGYGLGLAVSRRVVELMNGRIWAKRRTEAGSEFGFALPVAQLPVDLAE